MIITRLRGGLGNQLFQYAAGRRLAALHDTVLKLDISFFQSQDKRDYSLSPFNISQVFATPEEVTRAKKGVFISTLSGESNTFFSGFIKSCYRRAVFSEPYVKPYPAEFIRNSRKNTYLDGYWQSEKYFNDIQDIIRAEFTLKQNVDELNHQIAQQIRSSQSVSIHIRRGDYVTEPETNLTHGVLPVSYYQQSIEIIRSKIANPTFFVFSDDQEWAVNSLHIDSPVFYVTNNGESRKEVDLWLMSICCHHIIANSSFSWWGAWLSTNSDMLVISPRRWFADQILVIDDLIPEDWIRI